MGVDRLAPVIFFEPCILCGEQILVRYAQKPGDCLSCYPDREFGVCMLQKPVGTSNGKPIELPASSAGDILGAFPKLLEWLLQCSWPDGSSRATSTLTVSVDDGRWKLRLSDRACGQVLFISGETCEDAFLSLEQGLLSGKADWRRDNWSKGGKR